MHDLPFQGRLQQAHARPISGEELEAMGKAAAATWTRGKGTLSSAVVETVKHAGLSPEQVCRVVEFANTAAYLNEFNKEGSANKVIEFVGGPASPSDVLRDLNDGGGGTVFDRGLGDYNSPPAEKRASADAQSMRALFGVQSEEADPNPFRDVLDLRDKLATILDHTTSQLSGLEIMADELEGRLYHQVKLASLEGLELGEIVRAWSTVTDDPEHVKIAFESVTPRLLKDEVFMSFDHVGASLEKTGSARLVNVNHPLIGEFSEYIQTLQKMAELRVVRNDAEAAIKTAEVFLKEAEPEKIAGIFGRMAKGVEGFLARRGGQAAEQAAQHVAPQLAADRAIAAALEKQVASKGTRAVTSAGQQAAGPDRGLVGGAVDFFRSAAEPVRDLGHSAGGMLFGEGSNMAKATGNIAGGLVQYAPHIAAGAGAYRLYQHGQAFSQSPTGQKLRSFLPNTPENLMVQQDLQSRYSGEMPYFATGPYVNY